MFVTVDLLRKHNACEQGIKYIERFYPNGADMNELLSDRHISKEFLHWGREHLTTTDEDLKAYCKACRIENSKGFWYSQDVRDSQHVIKSKQVNGSIGVFGSSYVGDSIDVVESDNILNSKRIFDSSMIDDSEKIFKSQNITRGINVCNSTMVADSKNIIDACGVFDSSEIIGGLNISNSYFCHNCKEIKHCMFCDGLENAEYYVFNKPVDKKYFELFEKQYLKYMTTQLDFIREWPEDLLVSVQITPTRKFDDWYHSIPDRFWKWARTLPHFDPMLVYNITLIPELLNEQH